MSFLSSLFNKGMIAALAVVTPLCFAAEIWHAHAAPSPSRQDYAWLATTKKNQTTIAVDHPAYDRVTNATANGWTVTKDDLNAYNAFVKAKADNAYKVAALQKDGWQVQWNTDTSKLALIPFVVASNATGASYDPKKLAIAISCAETSCGKDGTAIHRNNCCGIMTWKTGQREPAYFPSYQASLTTAAAIWNKSYGKLPDLELAKKWTGNDHPVEWLNTFYTAYNSIQ